MFGLAKFGHDTVRFRRSQNYVIINAVFAMNVGLGVCRRDDNFAQRAKRPFFYPLGCRDSVSFEPHPREFSPTHLH